MTRDEKKYLEELEFQFHRLKVRERVEGIKRHIKDLTQRQIGTQLNLVDQLKTQAMLIAEKNVGDYTWGRFPTFQI